jgi:hypothetical protein
MPSLFAAANSLCNFAAVFSSFPSGFIRGYLVCLIIITRKSASGHVRVGAEIAVARPVVMPLAAINSTAILYHASCHIVEAHLFKSHSVVAEMIVVKVTEPDGVIMPLSVAEMLCRAFEIHIRCFQDQQVLPQSRKGDVHRHRRAGLDQLVCLPSIDM